MGLLCLRKAQDQREGSQSSFLEEVACGMQSWVDARKEQKASMKRAGAEDHVEGRHRLGFAEDSVSHERWCSRSWVQNLSDQKSE